MLQCRKINVTISEHAVSIAKMQPTVDTVRGIIWKVATAAITGGGGVALLVIAANRYTS